MSRMVVVVPRVCQLALLLNGLCVATTWAQTTTTVQVETAQGVVEGLSNPNGRYFLGMRYATPPLGNLRWRRPVPVANWTGVYNATAYGADCYQYRAAGPGGRMVGGWYTINGLDKLSEDCLFINVYTPPQVDPTAKNWPVMVYFHAGEFYMGAGNDLENNWPFDSAPSAPSPLLQHGLVIVTLNYRLGNLGFLAADELRSRDPSGSTGNYGVQDQRQALLWVQENIGFFGGDSNNVILAGESSGGTSVAAHLIMKQSWGLFHKVIMQSPGFTQIKPWNRAYLDAKFLMAQMSLPATAGPLCQMIPFGGDFNTPGAWIEYPMPLSGKIYLTADFPSVADAVNACNANLTCLGVQYYNHTNSSSVTAGFSAEYALHPMYSPSPAPGPKMSFSDNEFTENQRQWPTHQMSLQNVGLAHGGFLVNEPHVPNAARTADRANSFSENMVQRTIRPISTFLRAPNMSLFVDCVMGQSAQFLADNFDGPFEDTIFENLFGPVPDGVEFNGSLVSNLLDGPLPPNVSYLVGSNLDEGTEFIGITAPLHPCNMTDEILTSWAYLTFKNIDSIANNMSKAYANVEMPVPTCPSSNLTWPLDKNHIIATRAVADGTFLCLVRVRGDLAVTCQPIGQQGKTQAIFGDLLARTFLLFRPLLIVYLWILRRPWKELRCPFLFARS
eukprot:INCI458.2.p1 GENE.INCI458.2~~INCI458.2.p1  ORF type:complete len:671 (-),score=83.18 INCI458.2:88-2100(-)